MIDLEFVHAKSKWYLKTSIMIIIVSRAPSNLLLRISDCTRHGNFHVPETGSIDGNNNETKTKNKTNFISTRHDTGYICYIGI